MFLLEAPGGISWATRLLAWVTNWRYNAGESGSGIILSEIIKSKGKLYAALHKVKDRSHANISAVPQGPSIRAMEVAIPGASSSQAVNLQSGFVPADLPEPLIVGPSSSKKRQKNQEEADKKLQYDTQ